MKWLQLFYLIQISILQIFLVNEAQVIKRNGSDLAATIKITLHAIAKPLQVTVIACWTNDFSRNFFVAFNNFKPKSYHGPDFSLGFSKFLPDTLEEHQEIFILDINCEQNVGVLNNATDRLDNSVWLILNSDITEDMSFMEIAIQKMFSELPILLKSEVFYLFDTETPEITMIKQLYRTHIDRPLIVESFGVVNLMDEIFVDYREVFVTSRRRQNLQGLVFNASMVITNNDTLKHLTDYHDKHIDPITKVNYILTNHLLAHLNASASYSVVYSWGYRDDKTGEWSGMVGQLIRNEAELGASPLFMTTDRVPLIQYIAMPTPTGSRFVFRSPKLSYTDNVFLLPFDNLVWYCLIVLVIVTALFLTCSVTLEWKHVTYKKQVSERYNSSLLRPFLGDVFLLIFGATCQQGSNVTPRSVTARIIMMLAFVILMFLYTSYSANIVALLQSPSTKIRTLEDLYRSRLRIGVDDTVFNRYYFSHTADPIRKGIYQEKVLQKNERDNFMHLEEGVKKIREGLFAFHMELGIGYKVMAETFFEDEKCGLVEVAFLQVTNPWYAIRKNSTYKELFKNGMIRMHEHGIQERENSRLYTKRPKCSGSGGNFITASLVDTKPALLVLAWGYLFALCLFAIEILTKHLHCLKVKKEH